MIIINTLEDIKKLKDQGSIDSGVIEYLEKYFIMLSKEYVDGMVNDGFSLEKYGSIVFLENAEDAGKLSSIGLHTDYRHTFPEYVERIKLRGVKGLIKLYCACITINNDFAITAFSTIGALDVETERFLRNECD